MLQGKVTNASLQAGREHDSSVSEVCTLLLYLAFGLFESVFCSNTF